MIRVTFFYFFFFFFNDTATTEIYTLSLHDALPIFAPNQRAFLPIGQAPTFDLTNVFVAGGSTPALRDTYMSLGVDPYFKQPYVHEWSFNIQSQLTNDTSIEFGYVGTAGIKLGNLHLYANQPKPGIGPLQPRRPWPDFGP